MTMTVPVIDPVEAKWSIEEGEPVVLLDVRTEEEFLKKHIPNAVLQPLDDNFIEAIRQRFPDYDTVFYAYCQSGRRSREAVEKLVDAGYCYARSMGSIDDWPYEVEESYARPESEPIKT